MYDMESLFHNQSPRNSKIDFSSSKEPRSQDYFLKLAARYKNRKLYKEALYTCDQAIFHYGLFPPALLIKARCYFYLRQYAKSLSSLRAALKTDPKNLEAFNVSMDIHKKLKQEKSFSNLFQQAARIRSENESTKEEKNFQVQEERSAREQSTESSFDVIFATKTVAELYLRQGLKEKAKSILEVILKREPGNDWAKKQLESLEQKSNKKNILEAQAKYLHHVLNIIESRRRPS